MPEPFSIKELRRQSGAQQRRGRHWRKTAIVVLALYVLFLLAGFFIAPPIVRPRLERGLSAALHREVVIRRLRLNPCVFSATIDGLAIRDRDGRPLFGCERLYVNVGAWSLLTRSWLLQQIVLTAPTARLEIAKDGSTNIDDLLTPRGASSARALRIGQLTVTEARFAFADHSRPQDFATELGPISFSLKDFSTKPAPGAPYEFTAITESDELLHWRGTFSAKPLSSTGEFVLERIALKKYAPYYSGRISGDVLAGTLDILGNYELNFGVEPRVLKLTGGQVRLRGFQLAPRGEAKPALDFPAADLANLEVSFVPLKISAKRLDFTGGHIAARRATDGKLNLAAIFSPIPSPSEIASAAATAAKTSPVLPNVALGQLEIHALAVTFDDATTPRPAHAEIALLDLSAHDISTAPGAAPIPLQLAMNFAPRGALSSRGTFTLASRRTDLDVELKDLSLTGLAPYAESFVRLRFPQGSFSAQGRLTLSAAPSATFRGDAELSQLAAIDDGGENFANLASLGFKQLDFNSSPLSLGVAQISLLNPSFNIIRRPDNTLNLAAVFPPKTSTAAPAPGAPAPSGKTSEAGPKIAIERVVVANGSFAFNDRAINPRTQFSLDQLAGMISDISSDPASRASVNLRGKVDNSAPVSITGQAQVFGAAAFADLTASCAGADLLPTDPYFGKYAGYRLDRGDLTCDIKLHLAERRLDSHTSTTLDQFTLGERTDSPVATHLPVRLAIALLKDANGKIVLDMPIAGSLDDPNFEVGGVALKFVVDLLAKAATAPFSLLGAVFGGGDRQTREQLDHVDFAEGSSALSDAETHKLDVLARVLAARPGLSLGITGEVDPAADGQALARRKVVQAVRQRISDSRHQTDSNLPPPEQLTISPEEYNHALTAFYAMTFHVAPGASVAAALPGKTPPPVSSGPPFLARLFGMEAKPAPPPVPGVRRPSNSPPATTPPVPPRVQLPPVPALSPQEMEARLAEKFPADESDLRQLASDRAQRVKAYLLDHGLSERRISVAEPVSSSSAHRVMFQLK